MTKYRRIRDSQPAVREVYPDLAPKLDALERLSDQHFDATLKFMGAGDLYSVDLLLWSVVGRSIEAVDSFVSAFDHWNVSVASAVVRMQVDNVLQAHLFAVYPDSHELLLHIMDDKPLRQLAVPS